MEVLPTIEDESIDLSVIVPPFAGLYNYSSSVKMILVTVKVKNSF
jgi:hypothetical protein